MFFFWQRGTREGLPSRKSAALPMENRQGAGRASPYMRARIPASDEICKRISAEIAGRDGSKHRGYNDVRASMLLFGRGDGRVEFLLASLRFLIELVEDRILRGSRPRVAEVNIRGEIG